MVLRVVGFVFCFVAFIFLVSGSPSLAQGLPTFTPTRTATTRPLPTFTPTRTATSPGLPTFTPTRTLTRATPPTRTATRAGTTSGARSITRTPTRVVAGARTVTAATVLATRPRPTLTPTISTGMQELVSDQIVTAVYASPDGTLYYGVAQRPEFLAETLSGGYALWKKPVDGAPYPLTPWTMNVIGGVTVRGGVIYFNEGGTLRRMPDDNVVHEGEVVIRFPTVSKIYGHVNSSLAQGVVNGKEALLISVGSSRDSAFPAQGTAQDVYLPYYEDFPNGRILYANFDWLESTHEYQATRGMAEQFDELARGVRNPWGMTAGLVDGQYHVLAADNDPAFVPEKNDGNPANAGDELNDIYLAGNYGHPYVYGGSEVALGYQTPIVVFPDGSVPSGVAIAAGKGFVSLQNAGMIVQVDLKKRTYRPVLTGVQPYNLYGVGSLLYIADFGGVHVIDARSL